MAARSAVVSTISISRGAPNKEFAAQSGLGPTIQGHPAKHGQTQCKKPMHLLIHQEIHKVENQEDPKQEEGPTHKMEKKLIR